jgi:hypothetical protein
MAAAIVQMRTPEDKLACSQAPAADAFLARKRAFNQARSAQTAIVAEAIKNEAAATKEAPIQVPTADAFLARKRAFNQARSAQTTKVAETIKSEAGTEAVTEAVTEVTGDATTTYGDWVNGDLEDDDAEDSDFAPDAEEMLEEGGAKKCAPLTRSQRSQPAVVQSCVTTAVDSAANNVNSQAVLDKIEATLEPAEQKMLAVQRIQQITPALKTAGRCVLSPSLRPEENIAWGDSDNSFCDSPTESATKEAPIQVPTADAFLARKRAFNQARSAQTTKVAETIKSQAVTEAVTEVTGEATYGDWVNGDLEDDDAEDSDFSPDAEEMLEEGGAKKCAPLTRSKPIVPETWAKKLSASVVPTTSASSNESVSPVEDTKGSENNGRKTNKQSRPRSRPNKKTGSKNNNSSNSSRNNRKNSSKNNSENSNSENSSSSNNNKVVSTATAKKNSAVSQRRRRGRKSGATAAKTNAKGENAGVKRQATRGAALAERIA